MLIGNIQLEVTINTDNKIEAEKRILAICEKITEFNKTLGKKAYISDIATDLELIEG
jgi:hypothetical protein